MAEQSSTVVLLRALVMLLCLVMIPVAALFGTAIPNVVKAFQAGRLPTLDELRGPAVQAATSFPGSSNEAPRYVPGEGAGKAANVAPRWNGPTTNVTDTASSVAPSNLAPRWPTQPAAQLAGMTGDPASNSNLAVASPYAVMPASYNTPVDGHTAAPTAGPLGGSGSLSPLPSGAANLMAVGRSATSSNAAAAAGADPFTYVENRLRELGATYFLLESWGEHKSEYRFYCKMAIGGNDQFTKAFWCVDGDPKKAMMVVLQQVEGWHSGGG